MELEQFGIKVILVEPFFRTNFANGTIFGRKALDSNSPYSQIMQKMTANWQYIVENGSDAKLLAQVVLNAITSKDPEFRHLAGKDIEGWMEARRSICQTASSTT